MVENGEGKKRERKEKRRIGRKKEETWKHQEWNLSFSLKMSILIELLCQWHYHHHERRGESWGGFKLVKKSRGDQVTIDPWCTFIAPFLSSLWAFFHSLVFLKPSSSLWFSIPFPRFLPSLYSSISPFLSLRPLLSKNRMVGVKAERFIRREKIMRRGARKRGREERDDPMDWLHLHASFRRKFKGEEREEKSYVNVACRPKGTRLRTVNWMWTYVWVSVQCEE